MVLLHALTGAAGVVALVLGAALVVEAGSALGRRLGVSPMWIGLTVVAVGTSAPEWVVSILATSRGSGELAVANVVGSNILNVLIVLGATAAVAAIPVRGVTIKRDLGLVAAASLAVWLLAADGVIHRGEGTLLFLLLGPYIVHAYRAEKRGYLPIPDTPQGMEKFPLALQLAAVFAGIALLVFGGQLVVDAAVAIARALGWSERIVGLTIVAIGTSLPELATSLVAASRRKVDLALGNLVGSNLMNLLLVLGTSAMVGNLVVERTLWSIDMTMMVLVSLLLLRFAATHGKVSRVEGMALLGVYGAYAGFVLL